MLKQKLIQLKRKKDPMVSGWDSITDTGRYWNEVNEYRTFLYHVECVIHDERALEYLEYFIDLLRKEIKYSSLLEINRGKERDRFMYPFRKFDLDFLGISIQGSKIDIERNNLISSPWNHGRYFGILHWLKAHKFRYDPLNHMAEYYDYINITSAINGFHSLGVGAYMGKGCIKAFYCDTTKLFPYLEANEDLSFSYNKSNVIEFLKKQNKTVPDYFLKRLDRKIYGTDYRLLLVYKLCQKKFYLEHNSNKEIL